MGPPPGAPPGMRSGGPVRGYVGGSGGSPLTSTERRGAGRAYVSRPYNPRKGGVSWIDDERKAAFRELTMLRRVMSDRSVDSETKRKAKEEIAFLESEAKRYKEGAERGAGMPNVGGSLPDKNIYGEFIDYDAPENLGLEPGSWKNTIDNLAVRGPTRIDRRARGSRPESSVRSRAAEEVRRRNARNVELDRLGLRAPETTYPASNQPIHQWPRPDPIFPLPPVDTLGDPFRMPGVVPSPDAPATPPGGATDAPLDLRSDYDAYDEILTRMENRPQTDAQKALQAQMDKLNTPTNNRSAMFGAMAAAALKGGEHGFAGTISRVMDARTPFLTAAEGQDRQNQAALLGAMGEQQTRRSAREDSAMRSVIGSNEFGQTLDFNKRELNQRRKLAVRQMNNNKDIAEMRSKADADYRASNRSLAEENARREAIMDRAADILEANFEYREMSLSDQRVAETAAYATAARMWNQATTLSVDPEGR
jgi:hypothetical protein